MPVFKGLVILLKEPNPGLRKQFANVLEKNGAEVVAADTVGSAIEALNRFSFSSAILSNNCSKPELILLNDRLKQQGVPTFLLEAESSNSSSRQPLGSESDNHDVDQIVARLKKRIRDSRQ